MALAIGGPGLQQLDFVVELHHGDPIALVQILNQFHSDFPSQVGSLGHAAQSPRLSSGVQHNQNIRGNVAHASDLLGLAVFKDQNIVHYQSRIVMSELIDSDDRQAHFFGKYFDRLLRFALLIRRG